MRLRTQAPKILVFAVAAALSAGALADGHHQDRHFPIHVEDHRGVAWGHGDIRHFHDFDFDAWHRGRWVHDWHDNHFGWWWVVGGAWVFFTAPVYPYPDPYVPSTVIVQTPPAAPAPAGTAPAPAYWYYCASAQNYYPYVTQCPVGWEQVPATPPPAPPAGAAPPPPRQGATPAPASSSNSW